MSSQIMSLQKSKHYGPLLRPAKLGRGLGSEPGQTMSYCTWGFEAKDSVPKSSHLTHPQELPELSNNHDPSCDICVTGGHCQQRTNSSALSQKQTKIISAAKLIWAQPLSFYFLDTCCCLIKYFFSWFINSQQHWTQSHSKGHVSLDQRQNLPWCSHQDNAAQLLGECRKKYSAGLCQGNQQQTLMLQKSSAAWFLQITNSMLIRAEYSLRLFKHGHKFRNN